MNVAKMATDLILVIQRSCRHMSVPPSNHIHPFLKGNFAPVDEEYIAHQCEIIGEIPQQLLGGQYIRNGGNPVYPPEKGRHYHW